MIVAYYQRCDSRSLSIISRDESEFKESRYIYIYIRYIVREIVPPASLLPTEGRREGEAIRTFVLTRNCNRSTTSMSNLTLFERYFSDPTLSRSTRFDILSLSFSFAHSSIERERESSVGKDRSMENYGYQAEKGKHFAREGAYRRNTDRDNWSQVTRTYEKGRR